MVLLLVFWSRSVPVADDSGVVSCGFLMLIALVFRIGPDGCANACSRIRILTTTAMSLRLVTATSGSPGFQIISGGSTNVVLSSHVFTDGLMLIFQDLSHLGSSSNQ